MRRDRAITHGLHTSDNLDDGVDSRAPNSSTPEALEIDPRDPLPNTEQCDRLPFGGHSISHSATTFSGEAASESTQSRPRIDVAAAKRMIVFHTRDSPHRAHAKSSASHQIVCMYTYGSKYKFR